MSANLGVFNCNVELDKLSDVTSEADGDTRFSVPIAVDANGRPSATDTNTIDRGKNDYYDQYFPVQGAQFKEEKDFAGGQRVYQGVMDAGALEADWRAIYASSMGRHIAVTKATEQVSVTEAKRVRIPDGNVVEAVWSVQSPFDRKVSVSVTGSGTLTVKLNGEVLGEQVGSGSKDLVSETAALSFSYSGTDGYAEIIRAHLDRGLCIMVK